ncbi:MAG: hypothetical protein AAF170_13590 [Bacteroidota bacterium]
MSTDHEATFSTPRGLIRILHSGEASRTRVERHLRFLVDNGVELAAAAFEGYTRHGAGAVVVWREEAPRRFRPRPFEPERLWYSTQLHVLPGATAATFSGWEAQQIEIYDPQIESVVLFLEGSRFSAYRIQGPMTPPLALRGAQAVLN